MSARLDPRKIEAALRVGFRALGRGGGEWAGKIWVKSCTESTNDDSCRLGQEGAPDGSAVFAEEQRAGRGRGGSRWSAPAGRNLTFSALLRPALSLECWPRVAHAAALAVARGVDPWLEPLHAEVKWPNDVYVDGRKLAGILVEAYPGNTSPFLVAGVGVNVNSTPAEFAGAGLERDVVSIASLNGGREVDRNDVGGALLAELWCQVRRCESRFEDVLDELRARSWLLGKRVRVWRGDEILQGQALDLGPNGELLVREDGGGRLREIVSADLIRPISA